MWDTLDDAIDDGPHAFDVDRYAMVATVRDGSTLYELGSVERYTTIMLAAQIRGERYLEEGPGFGLNLEVFPPTGANPPGFFLRGEAFAGWALTHWTGDVPGSVVVGAGIGGDALEVGDSVGRVYGLLRGRAVLWWEDEVTTSLVYEVLPFIDSPSELRQHEHRLEIPVGVEMLEAGPRVGLTFRDGGEPARGFFEAMVGVFVGVGIR
jgi:hypothetical protein